MPKTLRVMAYNILYGGTTGARDRTALLTAQVNAVHPDALALCECWGFLDDGAARMTAFCEAVGMRGALVEAATGNHVALLYREPWSPASTSTTAAPMHHGLVRMELTNGDSTVQVIATHLNPFSSLMRLQEAQVVVSRTRPGEHTLVMGDFNTLPLGYDEDLPSRRLLDEELRPDTPRLRVLRKGRLHGRACRPKRDVTHLPNAPGAQARRLPRRCAPRLHHGKPQPRGVMHPRVGGRHSGGGAGVGPPARRGGVHAGGVTPLGPAI